MVFNENVTSITREYILPKCFDQVLNGNVLTMRLMGNAKRWQTGIKYEVPIKHTKNTQGGVVGISDKLPTVRVENRTKLSFEPKAMVKPVVIADIENELNKGNERVIELFALEFDGVSQDLLDDFGEQVYEGTGSGNQWDSLAGFTDDSTNYGTYGSLSRTTYSVLNGTLTTSIGVLGLSDLSGMYDNCQVGTDRPSVIATTPTVFTAYEGHLQPTVRANIATTGYPQVTRTGSAASKSALGGDIGFDALMYRGTPIVSDERCPSTNAYFINEKHFKFCGVSLHDEQYIHPQMKKKMDSPQQLPVPRGFTFRKMENPTDQLAKVGYLVFAGNFIGTSPRTSGRLEGITG